MTSAATSGTARRLTETLTNEMSARDAAQQHLMKVCSCDGGGGGVPVAAGEAAVAGRDSSDYIEWDQGLKGMRRCVNDLSLCPRSRSPTCASRSAPRQSLPHRPRLQGHGLPGRTQIPLSPKKNGYLTRRRVWGLLLKARFPVTHGPHVQ